MQCNRRRFLQSMAVTGAGLCLPTFGWAGFDPLWKPGTVCANPIDVTVFEMFKIGPGPSSSHTIAPMAAGNDFIGLCAKLPQEQLAQADGIKVHLYGSLSATGKGHGTDRAVAAGLLGHKPEECKAEFLDNLFVKPDDTRTVLLGPAKIPLKDSDVVFEQGTIEAPFSNVLVIELLGKGKQLASREYYSVGGGFLQWKGWKAQEKGKPVHAFDTMNGLLEIVKATGKSLPIIMLENEMAITGQTEQHIRQGAQRIIHVMDSSSATGLGLEGKLKGPFGLERRAKLMLEQAARSPEPADAFAARLSAYGQAGSEENAMGHPIVTAPTAGSAGVMPAVVHMLIKERGKTEADLVDGLLVASMVGTLIKRHASVAGADVGCQGEIGSASSMAAAMLAQVMGETPDVVENAAELALEHHLGMTCDPVGGYVQIPCISRNAMSSVKSWNAWMMARTGQGTRHPVGLDLCIRTMNQTGRDMKDDYRETARGGLAMFYTQGC